MKLITIFAGPRPGGCSLLHHGTAHWSSLCSRNGGCWREQSPCTGNGIEKYTMDQTLSDQGQQATIAFDALAFVTGDACSDTFLPPGKVADYAGFQYLRDNDATQMGHNTDFVTRISDNVLSVLTDDQLKQFAAPVGDRSATLYAVRLYAVPAGKGLPCPSLTAQSVRQQRARQGCGHGLLRQTL